jgi:aspartate/tyrosine/aromatic aminotransferase
MNKFTFPLRNSDIIFETTKLFRMCTSTNKINLSIGIYTDDNGLIPSMENKNLDIKGDNRFINFTNKLLFNNLSINQLNKMYGIQTCGGTGSLNTVSNILKLFSSKPINTIIAEPTWSNHFNIFENIGDITKIKYNPDKFYQRINNINYNQNKHNVLLLQTSCHNPTGFDLNEKEWDSVFNICEEKNITVIMDTAYLGMANGLINDTKPILKVINKNIDLFICLSYSKIASLYGHRLGIMYFKPKIEYNNLSENLEYVSKIIQNNPPRMGSDILLSKYELNPKKLISEVDKMSQRIRKIREKLQNELHKYGYFKFDKGNGMFYLLPFDMYQIEIIKNKYNIYILPNGCINLCGINDNNFNYIVTALKDISYNYKPNYII